MPTKKPAEIVIAMQLIGMERLKNSVNQNLLQDKELILAMNSIDDVWGHFQWKESKLVNDAIDRFIAPRIENLNLDNINGSLLKWKEKWLAYHAYLTEQDSEQMCAWEEQYEETGSCPELEDMKLPPEFEWTPLDYTEEQWKDMKDCLV